MVEQKSRTLLPHVHVVDFSVPVLGLADATVGEGVAGVVGVHAEVEVMAGVRHGELGGGVRRQKRTVDEIMYINVYCNRKEDSAGGSTFNYSLIFPKSD